jgi:hypothetical protein
MVLVILLGVVLAGGLIFVLSHLRPLTEAESEALSHSRRRKAIQAYYSFDRYERSVDYHFKKNMAANGSIYNISQTLFEFPALAAGLLKYKKHEWIIVAFERNQRIDKLWLNKGLDRSQVHFGLSLSRVRELAVVGEYSSVLIFHNHPNPDPSFYSTAGASGKDKETAGQLAGQLVSAGVNLLEFVCERGRHHEYWRSVSDTFMPLTAFLADVQHSNGISGAHNLGLHWERLWGN